jgi:thymidylate kinase
MVSLEESVRRCAQKVDPFPAAPEVQAQRYSLYQALATSTSDFTVIDATPDTDTVFAEIMVAVDARMAYKTAGVGCGN